jgi:hypothetical protein
MAHGPIALTYDGIDLQDYDGVGWHFDITQGLNEAPSVRGVDVVVPSRDGRVIRPRRVDVLKIVLLGHVYGPGSDDASSQSLYRANVTTLRELFHPARVPGVVGVVLEDGAIMEITARPLNTLWNEKMQSQYAVVSVELESVDPEWRLQVDVEPSSVAAVTAVPVPTVTAL